MERTQVEGFRGQVSISIYILPLKAYYYCNHFFGKPQLLFRSALCVLTSNKVHLVSLAHNYTVKFSNSLKLLSGMEKSSLTGPLFTGSFEKQSPGQIKINASLQHDSCRRNGILLPLIFLLRNRSKKQLQHIR